MPPTPPPHPPASSAHPRGRHVLRPNPDPRRLLNVLISLICLLPAWHPFPNAGASPNGDPPAHSVGPIPPIPSLRPEQVAQGRYVFERHCILCHGRRGNGKGELAATTFPRPRDFTRGLFKYRSTPSGSLPTDDDLARTIQGGLTGTAMPAFTQLPERDVRAVIHYLKSLSPRWTQPGFLAAPVPIPPDPAWLADPNTRAPHALRGATLYQASCAPCHGPLGAGDGPAAASLTDAWENPCPPRDLRNPILRTGASPSDVHRTLITGLDGTPMPSFADATSQADRWDIVAHILELRLRASTNTPR